MKRMRNALAVGLFTFLLGCPATQVGVVKKDQELVPEEPSSSTYSLNVPLPGGRSATLGAQLWRPAGMFGASTVVIMVPGSGAISRRGVQDGDGVAPYESPVEVTPLWAAVFAKAGYATLAYDKRNCSPAHDRDCRNNPVADLDQEGPKALRRDVDAACLLAKDKLGAGVRIVLWTDTQGTQVVLSSTCKDWASALVFVAPITERIDHFWVDGLMQASRLAKDGVVRSSLSHRARSLGATFESINKGLFDPGSKIMGVSLQFWKEWIALTRNAKSGLEKVDKPSLFLVGAQDKLYPAQARKNLESLAKSGPKTVLVLPDVDHNLLVESKLAPTSVDQVLGALASLLKRD